MISTESCPRVRDVLMLVARREMTVGSTAIHGCRNRRARAAAVGAMITAQAIEALDDDLGSMLGSALKLQHELADAARHSRAQPERPIVLELVQLAPIPATASAELAVLVNGVVQATINTTLSVVFELASLQVEVHNGWLTGLGCEQSATVTLSVDTVRIGLRRPMKVDYTVAEGSWGTGWGPVPLSNPIPLPL